MSTPAATDKDVVAPLGKLAARGALVTMGGQGFKILLQFGGIIILARLLSPTDYGLLAMVIAVVGIGEVLRDFGLSSAAIQASSVSAAQRSNLFWINSSIGLALSAAVVAGAPWIAVFYDQPLLEPIAQALAVTFLLNGLATQFRAQLNRDMRFGRLAIVEIAGQVVGLVVGVVLALKGYGYWALVAQQVSHALAMLMLYAALSGWWPGLPRRCAGMGSFLRYGWNLMLTQLIGYASRNVDALVIGQRFGAEALGLYNRAYQILMLPLNQINAPATTIALPVLSRLKAEPQRYNAFLLHGQAALLHVVVGVFAFACAQAEPLILLVLGPQWAGAVPIFQILAIGGAFQAAGYATYWVFLSKGLTGSQLRFVMVTRVVIIAAILIGSLWGVFGVAVACAAGLGFKWLLGLYWIRDSGAPAGAMLRNGLLLLAAYSLCAAVSALVTAQFAASMPASIALGAAAMLATFGLLCAVWPAFRASVAAVIRSRSLLR